MIRQIVPNDCTIQMISLFFVLVQKIRDQQAFQKRGVKSVIRGGGGHMGKLKK